ncbi:MAG: DUF779 domain-containing protein [Pseudomonadota bacterium]
MSFGTDAEPFGPLAASPAARDCLRAIRRECGRVILYLGETVDGAILPVCMRARDYVPSGSDRLLGRIAGTPVLTHDGCEARWCELRLLLDVAQGRAVPGSLTAGEGRRFEVSANPFDPARGRPRGTASRGTTQLH